MTNKEMKENPCLLFGTKGYSACLSARITEFCIVDLGKSNNALLKAH